MFNNNNIILHGENSTYIYFWIQLWHLVGCIYIEYIDGANSAWTSDENFLVGLCRNIEN